MGANTTIEWAHHTFNPWWGCQRVSPGCENCYAESFDARRLLDGATHWGPTAERRFFRDRHWSKPIRWNSAAGAGGERHRVFCASMADVFELLPIDHPSREQQVAARKRLWELIGNTPHLDWLLLTKRPENFVILPWIGQQVGPPRNVWLGVTAEDQQRANERIPLLLHTPAARRFVSYEPALGPIDLRSLPASAIDGERDRVNALTGRGDPGWYASIDWVIAGAESGPGARPCDDDWLRSIRDQCAESPVAFFLKQKATNGIKISLPQLDDRVWCDVPTTEGT